jgi:hypothetical protein
MNLDQKAVISHWFRKICHQNRLYLLTSLTVLMFLIASTIIAVRYFLKNYNISPQDHRSTSRVRDMRLFISKNSVISPASGWNNYSNSTYHINFKYPKQWATSPFPRKENSMLGKPVEIGIGPRETGTAVSVFIFPRDINLDQIVLELDNLSKEQKRGLATSVTSLDGSPYTITDYLGTYIIPSNDRTLSAVGHVMPIEYITSNKAVASPKFF